MPARTPPGTHETAQPGLRRVATAWAVHLFTASGAVFGFFALLAIMDGRWVESFLWMGLTILVDGLDGMLARHVRVKEVLPHFNGALLDNMVDYFTYVLVPAVFLHQADLLPEVFSSPSCALIMVASAYQFCQCDAKTSDHYFKGWPSYWNLLAFYLFLMDLGRWTNLVLVLLFATLVFVPVKYVYPSRTRRMRSLTVVLTGLWAVSLLVMLLQYPEVSPAVLWASLGYVGYYYAASAYVTFDAWHRSRTG